MIGEFALSKDWESTFRRWSKPSSETEADKQQNAERMIRDAIRDYLPLQAHQVSVFAQGWYRNNTNVRQDSDVDICVCCRDTFFFDFSFADYGRAEAGFVDSPYYFGMFKDDVQKALKQKFGFSGVTRGNKAIDVHENSYRVDADVFCAFEYRLYRKRSIGATVGYVLPPGVKAFSDAGLPITNWPEQNYSNGVAKNGRTALLEHCVTKSSGTYAMEDTDSMAIVSTKRGGMVPCPGGKFLAAAKKHAVKALSWAQVRQIVRKFEALNPYRRDIIPGSVLKIEDDNFDPKTGKQRQIYCYAISAKRYALFIWPPGGEPALLREKVNKTKRPMVAARIGAPT